MRSADSRAILPLDRSHRAGRPAKRSMSCGVGTESLTEVFVILVADFILARDLAEALRDLAPGSTIMTADRQAEALAAADGLSQMLVFLDDTTRKLLSEPAAAVLVKVGATVIRVGDEWMDARLPRAGTFGVELHLSAPFRGGQVATLYMEILARRRSLVGNAGP